MTQAVFPDFHKKMETIFVVKHLFTQIRVEGKLQKNYCAGLFLIHMDALTLLTTDFFSALWNCLQLWVLADILGFSLLQNQNSVLSTTCPTTLGTSESHPLDGSRKYHCYTNHPGCFPALIFSCLSWEISPIKSQFLFSSLVFLKLFIYFKSISPTGSWKMVGFSQGDGGWDWEMKYFNCNSTPAFL